MNASCLGMPKTIQPMVLRSFLAAFVFCFGSAPVIAAESFTTECPRNHPDAPENAFQFAFMLHDGEASWAAGDDKEMVMENGLEHWVTLFPKNDWWFHQAALSCYYGAYKDGPELRIPLPGVLREYHVLLRPPRTAGYAGPKEPVFVRAWAVSANDPISESHPEKRMPPK